MYGYAISKFLPVGGFTWLDSTKSNLDKNDNEFLRGYVLEIDLEYSKELHEFNSDYPLDPDKLDILIIN